MEKKMDTIIIDGVEYELVPKVKEEKKSIFDRVEKNDSYYFIGKDNRVWSTTDFGLDANNRDFEIGNYCTDKAFMERRAKERTLHDKLERFSIENGGDKINWRNRKQLKFYFKIDIDNDIKTDFVLHTKHPGVIYFVSYEVAKEALELFRKEILEVYGR